MEEERGGIQMGIDNLLRIRESRPFNQRCIGLSDRNCINDRIKRLQEFRDSNNLNSYQKKKYESEILRLERKKSQMDFESYLKRAGQQEPKPEVLDIRETSPLDQGIVIRAHNMEYEKSISRPRLDHIINRLI